MAHARHGFRRKKHFVPFPRRSKRLRDTRRRHRALVGNEGARAPTSVGARRSDGGARPSRDANRAHESERSAPTGEPLAAQRRRKERKMKSLSIIGIVTA